MDQIQRVNPAAVKMHNVSKELGIPNINRQQATSLDLFDSLPVSGAQTEYVFFREASTRVFPFTNLGSTGNKLNVGEGMMIQAIYFSQMLKDDTPGSEDWEINVLNGSSIQAYLTGDITLQIGNMTRIKNIRIATFESVFNKFAKTNQSIFILDNPLFLPQLVEFELRLRVPQFAFANPDAVTTYVQCTMSGFAGILNLKKNI